MVSGNGATRSCIYREGVVDSGSQTTFQLAYVEWGCSLCWEGGEEGGRDGGREGGRKTCTMCVCVQTDQGENVNPALKESWIVRCT